MIYTVTSRYDDQSTLTVRGEHCPELTERSGGKAACYFVNDQDKRSPILGESRENRHIDFRYFDAFVINQLGYLVFWTTSDNGLSSEGKVISVLPPL